MECRGGGGAFSRTWVMGAAVVGCLLGMASCGAGLGIALAGTLGVGGGFGCGWRALSSCSVRRRIVLAIATGVPYPPGCCPAMLGC